MRQQYEPATWVICVVEFVLGGVFRHLREALFNGHLDGLENPLMAENQSQYQTFDHDVLVIGAGGAGLRAAIEASAAGVSVGLVCKSLLGKWHTGMA